jgi:Ca-activated chloride channel family protein
MKISRIVLIGTLLAASAHASSWSDLWYRRDQQGQHALQAGDSKRAAELFADPRRQAYAELQSDQYAAAAKRLAPFADAGSQYNRGNALAQSGDLQGALDAYDGALKHADLESALRRDAQHNRDLVARQLKAQKDQSHSSSGQQPPSKGNENGKPEGNKSKDGSGDSGSSSPSSPAQSKAGDDQRQGNGSPRSANEERQGNGTPQSANEQGQGNGTPPSSKDQDASGPEASRQQAAGQEANVGRQERLSGSAARSATGEMNSRHAAIGESGLPQTEQQLALEQWLRQIPDDPGGLLRRKFLIEHLMKQQQVQP